MKNEQKQALNAPLARSHVKQRSQAGLRLSYIESWHAIAEANRIFDFDGWSSETVEIKCVHEGPRKIRDRDGFGVSYTAKVRVTVGGVVREGIGAGHGIDADLGLAHESAIKEAESDARKRALMTFGNPFGLALYDKEQGNVADEPEPQNRKPNLPPQNPVTTITMTPAASRTKEQWLKATEGWREQIKRAPNVRALNDLMQNLVELGEAAALGEFNQSTYDFFFHPETGQFARRRALLGALETSRMGAA